MIHLDAHNIYYLFKFIKYFYKEKYEVEFHTRNIDFKIYVD